MHSNKFCYAWLGQGGGLKAVWKGFKRSIKLKEKNSDLIFQNFCSKTAEIGKNLWAFVGTHFRRVGTTLAHTTGKSSLRYAFWRVPHTQRSSEAREPTPVTPQMRRLCGFWAIQVRGPDPWGCPVKVRCAMLFIVRGVGVIVRKRRRSGFAG